MKKGAQFLWIGLLGLMVILSGLSVAPAAAKTVELKFSTTVPPVVGIGRAQTAWIKKMEKEAGGKLKVVPFWANSLLKPREIFRGVMDGNVDMAMWVTNIELGLMKLNTVTALPIMGYPSQKSVGEVHAKLVETFPKMKAEFRGVKTYGFVSFTPVQMNTRGKEVLVPSDMKGLKLAPSSPDMAKLVIGGGGTPVNLTVTDWYTSLEKGLVDGFTNVIGALVAFKVMDLLDYHTLLRPGGLSMSMSLVLINPDFWNDLPGDIQKVIMDNETFYADGLVKNSKMDTDRAIGYAKSKGHTVTILTPESKEWALWEKAAQPVHEQWIEKNSKNGGKEIYEEARRLINAYKSQ